MHPHPSPRSALRRGRVPVVALAAATCFLTFAAAGLAATGSVYVDGQFNVGAGHDFFGGAAPTNGSNVGLGYSVFPNLTTGDDNTAIGRAALRADRSGVENAAVGFLALAADTTGDGNVATGGEALAANTIGRGNTASGTVALQDNTIGGDNTANGAGALQGNTAGNDNTATGFEALGFNTTGSDNIALGDLALRGNTTGDSNIALGPSAGDDLTTGSDNIDIANEGIADESRAIRIGTSGTQKRTFLAGVSGTTLTGTAKPVLVKANGQLGTATSASAKASAKPLSGAVGRLVAGMKRQQHEIEGQAKRIENQAIQIERQGKEITALRADSR